MFNETIELAGQMVIINFPMGDKNINMCNTKFDKLVTPDDTSYCIGIAQNLSIKSLEITAYNKEMTIAISFNDDEPFIFRTDDKNLAASGHHVRVAYTSESLHPLNWLLNKYPSSPIKLKQIFERGHTDAYISEWFVNDLEDISYVSKSKTFEPFNDFTNKFTYFAEIYYGMNKTTWRYGTLSYLDAFNAIYKSKPLFGKLHKVDINR